MNEHPGVRLFDSLSKAFFSGDDTALEAMLDIIDESWPLPPGQTVQPREGWRQHYLDMRERHGFQDRMEKAGE